jgi:hypothetical protein
MVPESREDAECNSRVWKLGLATRMEGIWMGGRERGRPADPSALLLGAGLMNM